MLCFKIRISVFSFFSVSLLFLQSCHAILKKPGITSKLKFTLSFPRSRTAEIFEGIVSRDEYFV
jgi:hypothetical protein